MTEIDCITNVFEPEMSSSSSRRLKVSYAMRSPDYPRIPAIHLSGKWLAEVGFTTGTEVDVKVMNGCIVLSAKNPEPELMLALRQVNKLSARKQKQVQEFIGVISGKVKH